MTKKDEANVVRYTPPGSPDEVVLNIERVKQHLVSGNAHLVTESEVIHFIQLCKFQQLNPWLGEAYLIKYSGNSPATLVMGFDAFLKRAHRNPNYQGHRCTIEYEEKDKSVESMKAVAEVYVKNFKSPIVFEADYEEYVQTKKVGNDIVPNSTWTKRPKGQLKKCALVGALRQAFPEEMEGLYAEEEFPEVKDTIDIAPEQEETEPEEGTSFSIEHLREIDNQKHLDNWLNKHQKTIDGLSASNKKIFDKEIKEAAKRIDFQKNVQLAVLEYGAEKGTVDGKKIEEINVQLAVLEYGAKQGIVDGKKIEEIIVNGLALKDWEDLKEGDLKAAQESIDKYVEENLKKQ